MPETNSENTKKKSLKQKNSSKQTALIQISIHTGMKDDEKEIILDTNFDTNLEQDNNSTNLNSSKVSKYVEKNLKNFEIKCKGLKLIIHSKHCIML